MTDIVQRFVHAGHQIRVRGTDADPTFCAKDLCDALGITNYRNKVQKLDEDEKFLSTERTGRGTRQILFVTEPGLYKIILSCRLVNTPGTAPHAFCRWVTHDVLPSIRRNQQNELRATLEAAFTAEKARRLWIVVKNMDLYSFHARRRWFGRVCRDTKCLCVLDEFDSPHVPTANLDQVKAIIRVTMSTAMLEVPADQSLITQYFD